MVPPETRRGSCSGMSRSREESSLPKNTSFFETRGCPHHLGRQPPTHLSASCGTPLDARCRRAAPGTVRPGPPRGVGEGAGAGPCPHAKARRGPVSPRSRALAGRFVPLQPEVGGLGSSSAVEGASRVSPCDPLCGQLTEPAEGRPSWRGRCHRRV